MVATVRSCGRWTSSNERCYALAIDWRAASRLGLFALSLLTVSQIFDQSCVRINKSCTSQVVKKKHYPHRTASRFSIYKPTPQNCAVKHQLDQGSKATFRTNKRFFGQLLSPSQSRISHHNHAPPPPPLPTLSRLASPSMPHTLPPTSNMSPAFCLPCTHLASRRPSHFHFPLSPLRFIPISAKQKRSPPPSEPRQTPRSRRARRPRPPPQSAPLSATPSVPSTQSSPSQSPQPSAARDLQKRDAAGISLEHRLREEILHPLRKPKLTIFLTLAFSATLGMFFAMARASRDGLQQVSLNIAVDVLAISLFGYLAWTQVQFGRRSLNSIAGCPQARDLKILQLDNSSHIPALPFRGSAKLKRLDSLLGRDVVIVAGRAVDVEKYLERSAGGVRIVVVATDSTSQDNHFDRATAVASGEADHIKDWAAWLGDAVPPRKNIALFRIQEGDGGRNAANTYIVDVGSPTDLPLPAQAKRELIQV